MKLYWSVLWDIESNKWKHQTGFYWVRLSAHLEHATQLTPPSKFILYKLLVPSHLHSDNAELNDAKDPMIMTVPILETMISNYSNVLSIFQARPYRSDNPWKLHVAVPVTCHARLRLHRLREDAPPLLVRDHHGVSPVWKLYGSTDGKLRIQD